MQAKGQTAGPIGPEETILWQGHPATGSLMSHAPGPIVPLALIFGIAGLAFVFLGLTMDFGPLAALTWAFTLGGAFALVIALVVFPGTAILRRNKAAKTLYAVTNKGARVNRTLYPIAPDLPVTLHLNGSASKVALGEPFTRQERVQTSDGSQIRNVTTFPPSLSSLSEAEATAAHAALRRLQKETP